MSILRKLDPFGILKGPADFHTLDMPDEAEQDIVAGFTEKRDIARNARASRERSWEFNRLYLRGEQLIVRERMTNDVLRVVLESEVRQKIAIDNILRPTARAYVGKFCRAIPGVVVQPRSDDREDLLAAEVMESRLDAFAVKNRLRLLYKRAHEYLPWLGTAIFQVAWDHRAGRVLAWCKACDFVTEHGREGDPCLYCTTMGVPEPGRYELLREGEPRLLLHDAREFYPEPGVPEIDDMQWCIVKKTLPVAVVRNNFPEKAHVIHEENGLYEDRALIYAGSLQTARLEQVDLKGYVQLWEYHEMPSGEFPSGQIIYFANDRVLRAAPNPYCKLFGQLPFGAFRADRNIGEFWGEPPIDQAHHLQKERNKLLTQMRTHRELTINPKWTAPHNSGVAITRMDESPGQIIKYKSQRDPIKPLEVQGLPPYVLDELARLAQAIRDKFSVTEQEVGITQGDPSGRYAALLEAQSNEGIGPILIENSAEWVRMHLWVLLLCQSFEAPSKRWTVTGRDRVRSYSWDDVSIREIPEVTLADEDSLSKNPALRLQQALMLLDKGIFTNFESGVPDMKKFMRVAGLKIPGVGPDLEGTEHAYGAAIPDMIARGIPVQPMSFDDANIISEELLGWLRGNGRTANPQLRTQVQALWELYASVMRPTLAAQGMVPNPALGVGAAAPQQAGATPPAGPGAGPQPMMTGTSQNEIVQASDQAAESAARTGIGQENSVVG